MSNTLINRLIGLILIAIAALYYISTITDTIDLPSEEDCIFQQNEKKLKSLELDQEYVRQPHYLNLNILEPKKYQHILILTVLEKEDQIERYLDNYFNLIDQSTYPNKYITLSFLVVDNNQYIHHVLYQKIQKYQSKRWFNSFFKINVYQKTFDNHLNIQSRARNLLLTSSLEEFHDWVVWLDVQVYSYPKLIFNDFVRLNEDVIVPNCLLKENSKVFDKNNWRESDVSILNQQNIPDYELLPKDTVIGRQLLSDMPNNLGLNYKVKLDGVGESFIMVKSTVHRQGAIFPPFVYQHQTYTEGFSKMANSMGFNVYGIPGYIIYHY